MTVQSNQEFFDDISEFYDGMIGFSFALSRRKEMLKKFLKDEFKSVADLGCGSGLDSISLASLGLEVTGFDLSQKMIDNAKKNSISAGFDISFQQSSLDKIDRAFYGKFNVAFSMGNTFANLNLSQLKLALKKISLLLKMNGRVVIQILNYSQIIKTGDRIVNINNREGFTFIRFYDFFPTHFNFNIIKFKSDNPGERELYTTKLYPHNKEAFQYLLRKEGFRKIKFYGSLSLDKFIQNQSKDLIIVADK
ncbi:MAG: methyltransferase domain-containing protein [Ignavibacteriales bacterium]|nr:methyltransferase domain-containing protein [Ignavibacteriales bacterium]